MKTYIPKKDDIQRKWYVVDATDVVLGRLSTEVASILRGKTNQCLLLMRMLEIT